MSSRHLKVLTALATLLSVALIWYLYVQVPRSSQPFAKAVPEAEQFAISQGSQELLFSKDGEGWRVAIANGPQAPADGERLKSLLSSLQELRVEDEIATREDRWSDFEVTKESGTVVRFLRNQKVIAEGIVGKQAPDFTHVYYRDPRQTATHLASGLIRGDLVPDFKEWRNRDLVNLPDAAITTITIEGTGFKSELARSSNSWLLNGSTVDPNTVYPIVSTLAHLKADDFAEVPTDHLKAGKVTIRTERDTVTLLIGTQDKKTQRYPVSSDVASGTAWVAAHRIDSFFLKPDKLRQ